MILHVYKKNVENSFSVSNSLSESKDILSELSQRGVVKDEEKFHKVKKLMDFRHLNIQQLSYN